MQSLRSNITMNKKISRILDITIISVLVIYMCSRVIIKRSLNNKFEFDDFSFYVGNENQYDVTQNELLTYVNWLNDEIKNSPFVEDTSSVKIYFCDTNMKYRILSPLHPNSFGCSSVFANTIFINKSNFKDNTININSLSRSVSSVLIHELSHKSLAKKYFSKQDNWKVEGLCEYAAKNSSYPVEKGWSNFVSGISDNSKSYKYFLYRIAVTYLIDVEQQSLESIKDDKRGLNNILQLARKCIADRNIYLF